MIIATSISPRHTNSFNQHHAIKSWESLGEIYSLNSSPEIDILGQEYTGVTFVETDNTIEHWIYKPLVSINAFLEFALQKEKSLFLINSDIIIDSLPELKDDGVTILSRYDYSGDDISCGEKFIYGFDAVLIPYKFLNIFPESIYALGACWWDLFIPFVCVQNNIPIYSSNAQHIYHKNHPTHYSYQEWEYFATYFKKQFRIDKNTIPGTVATEIMATIKSNIIWVK